MREPLVDTDRAWRPLLRFRPVLWIARDCSCCSCEVASVAGGGRCCGVDVDDAETGISSCPVRRRIGEETGDAVNRFDAGVAFASEGVMDLGCESPVGTVEKDSA